MATRYTIATLGSHSALQILKGAADEGFPTLVITLKDRDSFYRRYSFIDEIITISSYTEFTKLQAKILKRPIIIVPHGSFVAYLGFEENKRLKLPYFGSKALLDWEADRKKQRHWMEAAEILVPHRFRKGDHIDRPVIVKSYGAAGGAGYFLAKNQNDFEKKLAVFTQKHFLVQEYIIGNPVYIHYFYSPLTKQLEILSIDRRYETNVDSLGRLPFHYQKGWQIDPSYVVIGNQALTLRESLLPEVFAMGERVITTSQKLINKRGLYGPFCLETIITPDQKIYVIEISCRIVAGTNLFIHGSPLTWLTYDEPMSTGRRIAREIKQAIQQKKLALILN